VLRASASFSGGRLKKSLHFIRDQLDFGLSIESRSVCGFTDAGHVSFSKKELL
jgi:hypothetical protein